MAAACSDRTVRLWSLAELTADASAAPMTFGGFGSAHIESLSVCERGGEVALAAADGKGGAVHWRLGDPTAAALWPAGSLGVESTRGRRLGCIAAVTAVALAPADGSGRGAQIGCGSADGRVRVSTDGSGEWAELGRAATGGAGEGGGAVARLQWLGGWLYAATEGGALLAWARAGD